MSVFELNTFKLDNIKTLGKKFQIDQSPNIEKKFQLNQFLL